MAAPAHQALEYTLAILKVRSMIVRARGTPCLSRSDPFASPSFQPDFLRRKHSVRTIKAALQSKKLEVVAETTLSSWPQANVEQFYGEHKGRFFYPRLVHYMGSGPISAVVLKGPNAIGAWRELIGPTHLLKAKQVKGCLRGAYAISDTKNSFHGSDSLTSASSEISQFFPDLDLASLLSSNGVAQDRAQEPL